MVLREELLVIAMMGRGSSLLVAAGGCDSGEEGKTMSKMLKRLVFSSFCPLISSCPRHGIHPNL